MLPHPLVLPSLLVLPLLLWAVAVLVGSLHNEALPDGADKRTFQHPLSDFDRWAAASWAAAGCSALHVLGNPTSSARCAQGLGRVVVLRKHT